MDKERVQYLLIRFQMVAYKRSTGFDIHISCIFVI